ncbi:hypothetical protein A3B51_03375 [Candidatus Curtissbacteria bacterium RIFCSPLOWO2_01_FULL_41_18]|uniref:Phospholipid/glycerol acyltransferase domain-containing protein n=2 Tax=Candidatus Curtissiibacteriota TaxID=1752717 RepID=A0A1F5FZU7_9BACT|nr:MAG: hypothetical protein A2696_00045 [Candidatus Curtissbacteria bacterium RIFCSPHIGHO2_01_FULL_41_13]OGE05051.1 MAG: hypothetical protein A3B51_03375 [Candidatus Curtissbacteria bacterium RIFCSPLOWO2_01_FULL_41_18]
MTNERNQDYQTPESPKTLGQLYRSVREAAVRDERLDLLEYISRFLEHKNIRVTAQATEIPNPNSILIIAPNHFCRLPVLTTQESFKTTAVVTMAASDMRITGKHISWFMKRLNTGIFDVGRFRETQNAAAKTFNSIPVEVDRRGKAKNLPEMQSALFRAIENDYCIGIFPEQQPSHSLKTYDVPYVKFLRFIASLQRPTQILPTSVFFVGNEAIVVFGELIDLSEHSDLTKIAERTITTIAKSLPRSLRGDYK